MPDEVKIKDAAKALEKAYNHRDADKAASFWAEDGVYVHPLTGERFEGRDAILKHYQERFTESDVPLVSMTLTNIEFPNPNAAGGLQALRPGRRTGL